jgi:hypothetical protein
MQTIVQNSFSVMKSFGEKTHIAFIRRIIFVKKIIFKTKTP